MNDGRFFDEVREAIGKIWEDCVEAELTSEFREFYEHLRLGEDA